MKEFIINLFNRIKPSVHVSLTYILLYFFIIFLIPNIVLEKMGIEQIIVVLKPIFSIFFILSIGFIIQNQIEQQLYFKSLRSHIKSLSNDEKSFMNRYLQENLSSIHATPCEGTTGSLEAKGLIFRSSQLGIPGSLQSFPYTIQPWVLKYLKNNPKYIRNIN
ncbi:MULTISPECIES: super-infection exclusion protein B [unclassified Oceanispirochaeta]|uniref:super-infection exclusion protein B n=1 Tax=unclassified Oceanispirochaeta TaxID=2635722 RepID=UPI001313F472|nr:MULTISPECIES: super-infection exclusion protein B [unclassified Oceanispirochaeta]MBF9017181.1 superinfection exclusion B family protein [Oceanispirochaeta sp. M2]MBF9017184.1 superinfection exclusion B family protein [Oceanispirochaeta sp. M2]NPD73630.1 hypothetical protein [Oceanispirochaeta sp. M1]NPD73633.1 hypothetical protein [Oceanispirochaeta sp. M1]